MKLQVLGPLVNTLNSTPLTVKCLKFNFVSCNIRTRMLLNRSLLNVCQVKEYSRMTCSRWSYPITPNKISKQFTGSLTNPDLALCKRTVHSNGNNEDEPPKPVLLYVQNPFRWLVNKLDFGMLRRAWDPSFKESDFKDGAKFAVSSITQIMSTNKFEDLDGLLTAPAINSLRFEVETKWTDVQRRNVKLKKDEIQVALPQRVRFQRIAEKKFCDIDMVFLALKRTSYEGMNATIFMEIKARFHRDYTETLLPDWTISLFKVTRFNILPR